MYYVLKYNKKKLGKNYKKCSGMVLDLLSKGQKTTAGVGGGHVCKG